MTTPAQGPAYGPPPASPYTTGPQQPPASKGMAVASLVLSLLFFIPLVPLVVSVILGVAVLNRSRDGRDHGRGLAVAALVIDGIVFLGYALLLLGVVLTWGDAERDTEGHVTKSGDVDTLEIRQGDCLNDSSLSGLDDGEQVDAAQTVKVVPCAQAHSFEVYHDFKLADGDFPGQKAVTDAADKGCYNAFKGFVGLTPDKSKLEVYYYFPQQATWESLDDRTVTCMVADPKGQSQGSLEGAHR